MSTLCDPMDCSPPGSSVHGILQARILEWVAISFSRESSWPRDQTQASRIAGRRFTCSSAGKEIACNTGDLVSIPGLGSSPGEGRGYLFQCSGLENSVDCVVHGVAKCRTRLSDSHSLLQTKAPAILPTTASALGMQVSTHLFQGRTMRVQKIIQHVDYLSTSIYYLHSHTERSSSVSISTK